MHSVSVVTVLTAIALCLPVASQTKQEAPVELTRPQKLKAAIAKLEAQMQGAWRLDDLKTPALPQERRREVGFCLVTGNYLSLELHLGWVGQDSNIQQRDFQSGTYRFELKEGGLLEASTVIGSFINKFGVLQFEEPNAERRYQIEMGIDRMTLRRTDGQTFVFVRLPDDQARRAAKPTAPVDKDKPSDETPPR